MLQIDYYLQLSVLELTDTCETKPVLSLIPFNPLAEGFLADVCYTDNITVIAVRNYLKGTFGNPHASALPASFLSHVSKTRLSNTMPKRKEIYLPSLLLKKSVFAADYKAKIRFYDLLIPAAEAFSNYEHWQTNRLSFTLYDFIKHCSVVISHMKFAYEQDNESYVMEKENITELITKLTEKLELTSFIRIGLRRQYLMPLEMRFDEIVIVLSTKLFSQRSELSTITPGNINDLMYRIDTSKDDYKFHITLGPVQKVEIPRYLSFNQELHLNPETKVKDYEGITTAYPEISLYFDVDVYRQEADIPAEQGPAFFDNAATMINEYTENMTKYLSLQRIFLIIDNRFHPLFPMRLISDVVAIGVVLHNLQSIVDRQ